MQSAYLTKNCYKISCENGLQNTINNNYQVNKIIQHTKMNLKRTLMLIFAAGVFSGANAQIDSTANQGKLILTLDSAKTYAVQHSKTMQTAALNIQKAEWAKWQSISNMLLNVDGTLSYVSSYPKKI